MLLFKQVLLLAVCAVHLTVGAKPSATQDLLSTLRIIIVPVDVAQHLHVLKADQQVATKPYDTFDLACHMSGTHFQTVLSTWLPGQNVSNLEVSWFKDGHPFRDTFDSRVTGWLTEDPKEDYQIRFDNFSLHNAGTYECHLAISHFKVVVKTTLGIAPILIEKPAHYEHAFLGGKLALKCQATGYPEPVVTWTNIETGKLLIVHTHLFRLRLTKADTGLYRCVAKNSVGSQQADTNLLITEKLEWLARTATVMKTHIGQSQVLQCRATSSPEPRVQWQFRASNSCNHVANSESDTNSSADGFVSLNHTGWRLVVRSITREKLGTYRCIVSSSRPCCPTVLTQPSMSSATCLREIQEDDEADINDVWSHSTSVLGRIPDAYSSSTVCRTSILHVFTVLLLSYFAACLV